MGKQHAWIVGAGSRAPVGLTSHQVAMMARAHKLEPRALSHILDRERHEVAMALAPGVSLDVQGASRLVALLAPAVAEALASVDASGAMAGERLPMVLAVRSETRPGASAEDADVPTRLAKLYGFPIDVAASQVVRSGHAGFAVAMEAAVALLAQHQHVLVGGVDTYYGDESLRWLDETYRLQSTSNDNGFIPSEGAAMAVLCAERGGDARGQVVATAADRDESDVNRGEVVTRLAGELAAERPLSWVMSDVNGEEHRVREASLMAMRLSFGSRVRHDYMPMMLGDTGAASGALYTNMATEYWRRGCAPDTTVMLALHSDGPERGFVLLEGA